MTHDIDAINQWFARVGEHILRWRWYVLGIIIILDVVAAAGLGSLRLQVAVEEWFLKDDPLTIAGEEFKQMFGNQDTVGILIEADDVFAPEILRTIRELGHDLLADIEYADTILSLTDFEFTRGTEDGIDIVNIVPEEIPTDPQAIEAIRRLAFSKPDLINRLFSDDSRQAWIILRLLPYPKDAVDQHKQDPTVFVGKRVLDILAQEKYQQPNYTLIPAGTPAFAAQEVDFFTREAGRLISMAVIIAVVVLLVALRSLRGVVIPVLTFLSALLWVFGFMGYTDVKVHSAFITLPMYLGVAVSIGYSIHIFNFFHRAFFATGNRRSAVLHAIEETGWPIFFTAATTIGALLSFYFVPIRQVQWMGFSSASVITATFLLVMTLTPILLSFGKNQPLSEQGVPADTHHFRQGLRDIVVTFEARTDRMLLGLSHWILDHAKPIIVVFIVLAVAFSAGIGKIRISTDYEKTHGLKIPYIRDSYYVGKSKVGSMYSYDVTLTFTEPGIVKDPEILRAFETLSAEIAAFPIVTRVSSLLDIIKDLHQVMQSDDPAYYTIPDDRELVAQLLLLYELSDGTEIEQWVDYDYTTLRLNVEVAEYDTAEVEQEFQIIRQRAADLFPTAKFGMVGTLMQISLIQNYVARGEIVSSLTALVVIGVLMMLVFQSLNMGLIGMIPNIAPVLVIFGLMGYLDIPLDMSTMIIVPIILGLAVDDTIHFINHSKLEFQRTRNYPESIHRTFSTVGKAIFTTSFILIASFSAYITSIALFFVHLALLMSAGVLSALLADYFITPILVLWTKPFGPEHDLTQE